MKMSPSQWSELDANKTYKQAQGRLQLRTSRETCLYVSQDGVQVLASVGTTHDVTLQKEFEWSLTFDRDDVRVFSLAPMDRAAIVEGKEVYTNADRMPNESEHVLAIRAELRKHKLEQSALLRDLKDQRELLHRDQAKLRDSVKKSADPVDPVDPVEAVKADEDDKQED